MILSWLFMPRSHRPACARVFSVSRGGGGGWDRRGYPKKDNRVCFPFVQNIYYTLLTLFLLAYGVFILLPDYHLPAINDIDACSGGCGYGTASEVVDGARCGV